MLSINRKKQETHSLQTKCLAAIGFVKTKIKFGRKMFCWHTTLKFISAVGKALGNFMRKFLSNLKLGLAELGSNHLVVMERF